MTPAARVAAAIELLDRIIVAARDGGMAADRIATDYFRTRRYAGSADRRAVRDLTWRAIRRFGDRPASGRTAMVALADCDTALANLFDGSAHAPSPILHDEPRAGGGTVPVWLDTHYDPVVTAVDAAAERAALLARAPVDVRVVDGQLDLWRERLAAVTIPGLPRALRIAQDSAPLREAVQRGALSVQDAGSQLIVSACAIAGGIALDLCAGAGGKALGIAARGETNQIVATDVDRDRLSRLSPRATAEGVRIETRLLDPGREAAALSDLAGACDLVLVDAPCSGSGTWRRNPETRWRLTPKRLARLNGEQRRLLALGAAHVRPGGVLVYAVCSVLASEGRDVLDDFLLHHTEFAPVTLAPGRSAGHGRLLTPHHDGTDGFFLARLHRLGEGNPRC